MWFPKIWDSFLRAPIIRTIIFGGLYRRSLFWETPIYDRYRYGRSCKESPADETQKKPRLKGMVRTKAFIPDALGQHFKGLSSLFELGYCMVVGFHARWRHPRRLMLQRSSC